MKKVIEFLFFRWEQTVIERGEEKWDSVSTYNGIPFESTRRTYSRDFVVYKYTNKFDKSERIKKIYLN